MNLSKARSWILKHGALLVFPISNSKVPLSLWHCFFPKSEMRWEWDSEGDSRVADLWHLREELSRDEKVLYAKWFKGRATFFSLEVAEAMIGLFHPGGADVRGFGGESLRVLREIQEESPVSTKVLKKRLRSEMTSAQFDKAVKPLWEWLLMVGRGEVDDGAFPSLNVGATELLFEAVWRKGPALGEKAARGRLEKALQGTAFLDFFEKLMKKRESAPVLLRKKKIIYGKDLW